MCTGAPKDKPGALLECEWSYCTLHYQVQTSFALNSAGCRQQGSYRSLGHVWIVCLAIMRNPFSSFIGTFHIWATQQVTTGPFPPRNRSEKPPKRRMSDRLRAPPRLLCVTSINEGPLSSEAGRRSEASRADPNASPLRVCKSVWTKSKHPTKVTQRIERFAKS